MKVRRIVRERRKVAPRRAARPPRPARLTRLPAPAFRLAESWFAFDGSPAAAGKTQDKRKDQICWPSHCTPHSTMNP
jgi:hypothetical protein